MNRVLIGAAVFVSSLIGYRGYFSYFGSDLTTRSPVAHLNSVDVETEGCEVVDSSSKHITIVAKSYEPTIVLREIRNVNVTVELTVYNLDAKRVKMELKKDECCKPIEKGNSAEFHVSLCPNEKRTIRFTSTEKQESFSFAVFGDSEGNDNPFTNRRGSYFVWRDLVSKINQSDVLFSIATGDLVDSGKKYHWRRFRKQIAQFSKPFFPVLGNEDVDPPKGRDHFRIIFGSENYAFSFRGCRFILFDDSRKFIPPEKWNWLTNELKSHPAERKFIFMHIPPYHPQRPSEYFEGWDRQSTEKFTDLTVQYKVEAVLASHFHDFGFMKVKGVPYWISGGAGGRPEKKPVVGFHFLKVNVPKEGPIQVEIIPLSSKPDLCDMLSWFTMLGTWHEFWCS